MPYPASCKPPVPFLARRSPRLWEASDSPPRPPRLAPRPPGFSMCRTGGFAVMIGTSRETGYPRGLRLTLPYVPQCGARSLKAEVLQRSACRLLVPGSAGMAPFTPTTCKSARPAQASASCFGSVAPPAAPLGISIWMSQRRTGVNKPSGGCRRPCCSRPIPVTSSTACDLACRSHQKPAPPSPRGPSLRLGTVFQLEVEGWRLRNANVGEYVVLRKSTRTYSRVKGRHVCDLLSECSGKRK